MASVMLPPAEARLPLLLACIPTLSVSLTHQLYIYGWDKVANASGQANDMDVTGTAVANIIAVAVNLRWIPATRVLDGYCGTVHGGRGGLFGAQPQMMRSAAGALICLVGPRCCERP